MLASPRARARETAALAGQGERAEVDEDLAEFDYGEYEGRTTADIREERPGWSVWEDGAPGGETAAAGRRPRRPRDRAGARPPTATSRCSRTGTCCACSAPAGSGSTPPTAGTSRSTPARCASSATSASARAIWVWNDTSHLRLSRRARGRRACGRAGAGRLGRAARRPSARRAAPRAEAKLAPRPETPGGRSASSAAASSAATRRVDARPRPRPGATTANSSPPIRARQSPSRTTNEHAAPRCPQDLVAHRVAELVVDGLEAVEVEEDEGGAARPGDRARELGVERAPVGEPGQRVAARPSPAGAPRRAAGGA